MADAEISTNFAALRQARDARKAKLTHIIACALAAGDTVREHLWFYTADWTLSCAQVGIIPHLITLPWMVHHLVDRHVGWGTRLEFPAS